MNDAEREQLCVEIARLYCQGLNQKAILHEIAKVHNRQLNAMQVSRLVREAKDKRLIEERFIFHPPRHYELASQLQERFRGLGEVIVVSAGNDYTHQLKILGMRAAQYFDEHVFDDAVVGLGGGRTIKEMIDALDSKPRKLTIVPTSMVGWGPYMPVHLDQVWLMNQLWTKCGIGLDNEPNRVYYATIPPPELKGGTHGYRRTILGGYPSVSEVWRQMQNVQIIFATVGPIEYPQDDGSKRVRALSKLLRQINVDEKWLRKNRVVGDLCYCLLNQEGAEVPLDFCINLGVDHLRKMASNYPSRRVVVVAGKYKEAVLEAVLRGGLCNVLIVEENLATKLLQRALTPREHRRVSRS